jgi:SAM-dependent methyltransferase
VPPAESPKDPTASDPHRATLVFYEREARSFFERTRDLPMRDLYDPFIALLPEGASILDAGCDSGRDARRFLEMGYRVTAFDASGAMCALASDHLGRPVPRLRFDEAGDVPELRGAFDGVWASASLLHVPREEMAGALAGLSRTLKPGGVFYASFRYGGGEGVREDGRWFTDFTEEAFLEQLAAHPELEMVELGRSEDLLRRSGVNWLGALMRKREVAPSERPAR